MNYTYRTVVGNVLLHHHSYIIAFFIVASCALNALYRKVCSVFTHEEIKNALLIPEMKYKLIVIDIHIRNTVTSVTVKFSVLGITV